MDDKNTLSTSPSKRGPWNKGKFTGAKNADPFSAVILCRDTFRVIRSNCRIHALGSE
jgi:hypothetical protein